MLNSRACHLQRRWKNRAAGVALATTEVLVNQTAGPHAGAAALRDGDEDLK